MINLYIYVPKGACAVNELTATICAIATPPGEGGIAVVRISGPNAFGLAEKVFKPIDGRRKVAAAKGYTAMFGHFLQGDREMDETVALFFRAPRSYTGEDVVELSVHGGGTMAKCLVECLIAAGAAPAGAGEFTRRAFENGRISLTQAEAVMDIISAGGRQGAALGLAALDGALAREIAAVQESLTALAGHIAAWVDYPEENVPELAENELSDTLKGNLAVLERLIAGYDAGAVLRQGVDAALLGRPNVGKSTLLNLLAGFERAIVTPVAGTTRDVVEQAVILGESGIRLNLFDTAGLRETTDIVEAEGIRRSYRKLEEAGLVLAVFDGSEPLTEQDLELCRRCQGKPALALVNKNDLAQALDVVALEPYFKKILPIVATDAASRKGLEQAVSDLLGVTGFDPGAASLSGQRQLSAATRARDALKEAMEAAELGFGLDAVSVCMEDALDALYALTGEKADEAVIEQVFSRFCVGK